MHHQAPQDIIPITVQPSFYQARPPVAPAAHSTPFTFGPASLPRPNPPAQMFRHAIAPPASERYTPTAISDFILPEAPGQQRSFLEERERSRHANLPQHSTVRPPRHSRSRTVSRSVSRGGRGSRGPSRGVANAFGSAGRTTTTDDQHTRKYLVCILPFCHGVGEEPTGQSPLYKFHTMKQTKPLIKALRTYKLCFEVDLNVWPPSVGNPPSIWAQLDDQVVKHLTSHHIVITHKPGYSPERNSFDQCSWGLLEARSNNPAAKRSLTFVDLYDYQFTEERLFNVCKNIPHPENSHTGLVFLEPLHANLRGTIDVSISSASEWEAVLAAHRCFPWHVWKDAFGRDGDDHDSDDEFQDSDIECFTDHGGCTSTVARGGSERRKASSSPVEDAGRRPQTRQRLQGLEAVPVIDLSKDEKSPDFPFRLLPSPALSTQSASRSPSPSIFVTDWTELPQLEVSDRASPDEVFSWQSTIQGIVDHTYTVAVDITGPSLEAIARTLFTAIQHNRDPTTPFVLAPGVTCNSPPSDLGFLHSYRRFAVANTHNPDNEALGDGPEHAHYLIALRLRVQDPLRVTERSRWADSGAFFRPTFHETSYLLNSPRCQEYFIDGRYAAFCIIQLPSAPIPICPFIVYMATQSSNTCLDDMTLAFIATLDPATAKILQPWFDIDPASTFDVSGNSEHPGEDENHPGMVLVQTLDISIEPFKKARSPELHQALHRRLLAAYFTGTSTPWDHEEFRAFAEGLNLNLSPHIHLSDLWSTPLKVRRLLVALYDRRVKTPDDIITRLYFSTGDKPTPRGDLFFKLFQWRFQRWLLGHGFPKELKSQLVLAADGTSRTEEGIISETDYRVHKGSPVIRGTLFLCSINESPLLPVAPTDLLIIRLSFAKLDDEPDYGPAKVLWHTCTRAVDIFFNSWLENLLVEPCSLDDTTTTTGFDIWMSKITSLKGGDYNRV
ncbi:hypothetical protein MSAN_01624100 [Mycena sanguinolenta]|uniref:Uncharacterized protein n=1 Tax=Mycena sanguinolenta TaxID=230812 RepID=A0A8H7CX59_9AGAR|nr:hypothetical protein MSAN_01624100 [Mycena sanguinolenta]